MNPYEDQNFFTFFMTFFYRFFQFLQGKLEFTQLAADEIQIIVLCCVAISSSIVGTFLILKKMTLLANSLSHTILLGIVIAYLFSKNDHFGHLNIETLLIASVIMGLVTTFLTEFFNKTLQLQEDASTAIIFTSLFAFSIVLVTLLTRNAHIGTEVVMGNVDGLNLSDCKLVLITVFINIISLLIFFKEFKIVSFDSYLAGSFGYSVAFFNYLLMILVSITIVSAFRAVGVIMVLSFLTGPSLTARLYSKSLTGMILLSSLFGIIASFIGVAFSRHLFSVHQLTLSTGGIVVIIISLLFCLNLFINKTKTVKN